MNKGVSYVKSITTLQAAPNLALRKHQFYLITVKKTKYMQ